MAGKYFLDISNESGKTSVPIVLKVLGKFTLNVGIRLLILQVQHSQLFSKDRFMGNFIKLFSFHLCFDS